MAFITFLSEGLGIDVDNGPNFSLPNNFVGERSSIRMVATNAFMYLSKDIVAFFLCETQKVRRLKPRLYKALLLIKY